MSTQNKTSIQVTELNYSKTRLDKWLAEQAVNLSRSHIVHLIDRDLVRVNGHLTKASYEIRLGDVIEWIQPDIESTELIATDIPLDIKYEDTDLLVINKPSGLVVHPATGHQQDTLVNGLLFHVKNLSMKNQNRPGIVHRIDKETSGLLVVAKNDVSHEQIAQQFKDKTTHRTYYAVVSGSIKKESGTIQSYLIRNPSDRKKYCSLREKNKILNQFTGVLEHAKWAITHYQVLQRASGMTLVKLQLETGRTHQIRVHLSELGYPIIGDITYGYSSKQAAIKHLNRFYLHAAELGFIHPRTQKKLHFYEPWPVNDARQLLQWGFKDVQ